MTQRPAWEDYLAQHQQQHLDELFALLRIPSVSTLPEHRPDIDAATEWIADHLRNLGVPTVAIMPTAGNPVVYGEWLVDPTKTTALIYGHYDVQPPDPVDEWLSPPFEPTIRDGRIYARGASDDKGNLFVALKGVEALVQTQGAPPINLKFLFEGEEEIGSPSLPAFLRQHKQLLANDVVLCADGNQLGPGLPSIAIGSKGMCGMQVNLRTMKSDVASGQFGAAAPNAVLAAIQLAGTLHTPDGRVAVAGYYDNAVDLTQAERNEIAEAPFSEEEFAEFLGATALWGEPGYSAIERIWTRPVLDITGFWGGFQGTGSKSVTPSEAHFKLSLRVVPGQTPEELLDKTETHLRAHCPAGATLEIERFPGSSGAYALDRSHPVVAAAHETLADIFDREPFIIRHGSTFAIAPTFKEELDTEFVYFSFGMPESRQHAPNENYIIDDCFIVGRRAWCALLNRLTGEDE